MATTPKRRFGTTRQTNRGSTFRYAYYWDGGEQKKVMTFFRSDEEAKGFLQRLEPMLIERPFAPGITFDQLARGWVSTPTAASIPAIELKDSWVTSVISGKLGHLPVAHVRPDDLQRAVDELKTEHGDEIGVEMYHAAVELMAVAVALGLRQSTGTAGVHTRSPGQALVTFRLDPTALKRMVEKRVEAAIYRLEMAALDAAAGVPEPKAIPGQDEAKLPTFGHVPTRRGETLGWRSPDGRITECHLCGEPIGQAPTIGFDRFTPAPRKLSLHPDCLRLALSDTTTAALANVWIFDASARELAKSPGYWEDRLFDQSLPPAEEVVREAKKGCSICNGKRLERSVLFQVSHTGPPRQRYRYVHISCVEMVLDTPILDVEQIVAADAVRTAEAKRATAERLAAQAAMAPDVAARKKVAEEKRRAAQQSGFPQKAIRWSLSSDSLGGITLDSAHLWVGTRQEILGLDPATGEVGETITCDPGMYNSPEWIHVTDAGILAQYRATLVLLERSSGRSLWQRDVGYGDMRLGNGSLFFHEGKQLVGSMSTVRCVDIATGLQRWAINGSGPKPRLFPIGCAAGLYWVGQRLGNEYFCLALDANGEVVHSSPIGGSADGGFVVGDAIVAGYRWASATALLSGANGWSYSPYPIATDGDTVLWIRNEYMKGIGGLSVGTASDPGQAIDEPERSVPAKSDGPGPDVVATDGVFAFGSLSGSSSVLNVVGAGRKARSKKLSGYLQGGLVAGNGSIFAVCQGRHSHWLACLEVASL